VCSNPSVDPTVKDTSSSISNTDIKACVSKINAGDVSEVEVQNALTVECQFLSVLNVLPASAVDGTTTVSTMIQFSSNPAAKTNDQICQCIIDGLTIVLKLSPNSLSTIPGTCTLNVYSATATGTSGKRQTTSGEYVQTVQIDQSTPAQNPTPASAGTLAPIWMMLFAIFLFFRL
jgi:hypothetical protein